MAMTSEQHYKKALAYEAKALQVLTWTFADDGIMYAEAALNAQLALVHATLHATLAVGNKRYVVQG